MRMKLAIHCLFWIFWYQDQRTVSTYLFTTNQLLVGYILTSIVSFTTNIKLRRTLFRTFSVVYDFFKFHMGVIHLQEIWRKNKFSTKLVDSYIKNFLNKKIWNTSTALTVEKKELFIALSCLVNLSLAIRTRLENSYSLAIRIHLQKSSFL